MEESDIRIICHRHNLVCHQVKKVIGSFDKELFVVDDKYLIRTSKKPMITEQQKINRVGFKSGTTYYAFKCIYKK